MEGEGRGGRGASGVSDFVKVISVCSNFLTPYVYWSIFSSMINRTACWVTTVVVFRSVAKWTI